MQIFRKLLSILPQKEKKLIAMFLVPIWPISFEFVCECVWDSQHHILSSIFSILWLNYGIFIDFFCLHLGGATPFLFCWRQKSCERVYAMLHIPMYMSVIYANVTNVVTFVFYVPFSHTLSHSGILKIYIYIFFFVAYFGGYVFGTSNRQRRNVDFTTYFFL